MALQPVAADEPKPWVAPTRVSPAETRAAPESGERRWVMPESGVSKTSEVDPQGSFVLELAGAIIGMGIGVGVLAFGLVELLDDDTGVQECEASCGALLVSGSLLVLFGPPAGATIAGEATGGEGSFGWSLVGTLAGLTLSLPGMVAGAIIGYRASAPDKSTQPVLAILPTPGSPGVQLRFAARW
jgi:hypothetical protein